VLDPGMWMLARAPATRSQCAAGAHTIPAGTSPLPQDVAGLDIREGGFQ
jgi:hypothetical protein